MKKRYRIGTRGSELALWQAGFVKSALASAFPHLAFEIVKIATTGDRLLDVSLSKIGDKGVFTRQIETALLDGQIDLAVHSLKDLQTVQPEGLVIGAVCKRASANDAFLSNQYSALDELPSGARVATGSLRRRSQLLNWRPDLQIDDIRGNVPTRVEKFQRSGADAMILAFAGLERLGLQSLIRQTIPLDAMVPAVGQGAIAVEIRCDDGSASAIVSAIDHEETHVCVLAERAFLKRLDGGCQVPIGAIARSKRDGLRLDAVIGSFDGKKLIRDTTFGTWNEPETTGTALAEKMIERGGGEILQMAREQSSEAGSQLL